MAWTRGVLAAVLLVWTAGAAAQSGIHMWVDEDGVTHFGERPPPGVESLEMRIHDNRGSGGLRPGEREMLRDIQQREIEQRYRREHSQFRQDLRDHSAERDKRWHCENLSRQASRGDTIQERHSAIRERRMLGC